MAGVAITRVPFGREGRLPVSAVFINYRTGDEEASATLIERELSRQFGSMEVFRASKTIQPGDDFEREILTAVRRSSALLAVIGPRWLTARDRNGDRALDGASDWTRREICEAFAHDVRVIPVLVGDVRRLDEAVLPAALRSLARCQYMRLSHRRAETDLRLLATTLVRLVPGLNSLDAEGPNGSGGANRVTNHFHQPVDAQFATFGIKL
jgi:hypothetical protein